MNEKQIRRHLTKAIEDGLLAVACVESADTYGFTSAARHLARVAAHHYRLACRYAHGHIRPAYSAAVVETGSTLAR